MSLIDLVPERRIVLRYRSGRRVRYRGWMHRPGSDP